MTAAFEVLDARDAAQRLRWVNLWSRWPDREVHAHPAYLELFLGPGEVARAAVCEASFGAVLYPFIERPLPAELSSSDARADLTSPYGYSGAYAWGDRVALATPFWSALDAWARTHGVVTEFVRFAVGTDDLLPYPGDRVLRQDNIVVPTDRPPEVLWNQYAHKVRKNVNRAKASGVHVEVDCDRARLADFLRIYVGTMSRRDASESYYFSAEFFEQLSSSLAGQFAYFHAILDGRVISTELALVSARRLYSFLGGTDEEAFAVRPNDLLKHEMIAWAHQHGLRQFVLGGGYQPDDGIYRYKRGFAPDSTVPFFTGHRVFDRDAYERISAQHVEMATRNGTIVRPGFFPAYRAPTIAAQPVS